MISQPGTPSKRPSLMTSVVQPVTPDQQAQVWELLQATSREPDSPYAIQDEYPIVLSAAMAQYSYGLAAQDGRIISHASLWPRRLMGHKGDELRVGLIGNVATHGSFRKRGLMTRLLDHLAQHAEQQGLAALILWSDLTALYGRIGYVPMAKEVRYFVHRPQLMEALSSQVIERGRALERLTLEDLTHADLGDVLRLRPFVPYTLARSIAELRQLLTIPNLHVLGCRDPHSRRLTSVYCVEKGVDMPQVVHEWGIAEASELPGQLIAVCEHMGYEQLMLLAPGPMAPELHALCQSLAFAEETHPMALVKLLSGERRHRKIIDQSFIWGLDGI